MKWALSAFLGILVLTKIIGLAFGGTFGWVGMVASAMELGLAIGVLRLQGPLLDLCLRGAVAFFLALVLVVIFFPSFGEGCGCFGGLLSESPVFRLLVASIGGLIAVFSLMEGKQGLVHHEIT